MKTYIFETNSKYGGPVVGIDVNNTFQRYREFGHPRIVEIKQEAPPRYMLNSLKDDRIFYLYAVAKSYISGVLLINTLKRAFPDKGCIIRYFNNKVIGTTNKQ